jgi:hypothetical protein
MGVSGGDTGLLGRDDWGIAEYSDPANRKNTMKTTIKYVAPWLAAAAIGGAIGLAPIASAAPGSTPVSQAKVVSNSAPSPRPAPTPFESGTDPLVPGNVGANPHVPFVLGAPISPDGEQNPSGGVDLAF